MKSKDVYLIVLGSATTLFVISILSVPLSLCVISRANRRSRPLRGPQQPNSTPSQHLPNIEQPQTQIQPQTSPQSSLPQDLLPAFATSAPLGETGTGPVHAAIPRSEIWEEHTDRTKRFYQDKFPAISESFVVVVGLGGVGSVAAHVLLRTGVGKMRLIDPDLVTISSLNRNALASRRDVGKSKVRALVDHFREICPEASLEGVETFFQIDVADALLAGRPDYVLDCIDNKDTKIQLLAYCKKNGLKVVSCFGAGASIDPSKIHVSDISTSYGCPFGKEIRKELYQQGISTGILCVYSAEQQRRKLEPLPQDELDRLLAQPFKPKLRVRTLPVTMAIPSIFGTIAANTVLNLMTGHNPDVGKPEEGDENEGFQPKKLQKELVRREAGRNAPADVKKTITTSHIRFLIRDFFDGKSALSDNAAEIVMRWRPENPLAISNLIALSRTEADDHFARCIRANDKVEDLYSPSLIAAVDARLATINDRLKLIDRSGDDARDAKKQKKKEDYQRYVAKKGVENLPTKYNPQNQQNQKRKKNPAATAKTDNNNSKNNEKEEKSVEEVPKETK